MILQEEEVAAWHNQQPAIIDHCDRFVGFYFNVVNCHLRFLASTLQTRSNQRSNFYAS